MFGIFTYDTQKGRDKKTGEKQLRWLELLLPVASRDTRLKRGAHTYMQALSQKHKTPFPKGNRKANRKKQEGKRKK